MFVSFVVDNRQGVGGRSRSYLRFTSLITLGLVLVQRSVTSFCTQLFYFTQKTFVQLMSQHYVQVVHSVNPFVVGAIMHIIAYIARR